MRLRKAIEAGDKATVLNLAWSNPRYLISSGDTPTVLQVKCEKVVKEKQSVQLKELIIIMRRRMLYLRCKLHAMFYDPSKHYQNLSREINYLIYEISNN